VPVPTMTRLMQMDEATKSQDDIWSWAYGNRVAPQRLGGQEDRGE
jgi:hypothetical protein